MHENADRIFFFFFLVLVKLDSEPITLGNLLMTECLSMDTKNDGFVIIAVVM